jgi:hypothetical protein
LVGVAARRGSDGCDDDAHQLFRGGLTLSRRNFGPEKDNFISTWLSLPRPPFTHSSETSLSTRMYATFVVFGREICQLTIIETLCLDAETNLVQQDPTFYLIKYWPG